MAQGKNELQPVRQSMVETAINFLQNPQVQNTSFVDKKAFLIKKGLTDEEIELAVEKSSQGNASHIMQHHALPPGSGQVALRRPPWLVRMCRMSSTFLVLMLSAYGLHQFYKLYLEPLLFGYKRKSRLDILQEQMSQVHCSISELQRAVTDMEASILLQKDEVNNCLKTLKGDQELMLSPITLSEVQSEISSIKSLLLSRHQFPDAPKFYPSIPSWQLPSASKEKDEKLEDKIENNPENSVEVLQFSNSNVNSDNDTGSPEVVNPNPENVAGNGTSNESDFDKLSDEDVFDDKVKPVSEKICVREKAYEVTNDSEMQGNDTEENDAIKSSAVAFTR